VGEPVLVVRRQTVELGHVAQREAAVQLVVGIDRGDQLPDPVRRRGAAAELAHELAEAERGQCPVHVEAELERAARCPGNRVGTVARLVGEGVERPLALEPAAGVLHDDGVARCAARSTSKDQFAASAAPCRKALCSLTRVIGRAPFRW